MSTEARFKASSGMEVFTGSELLVKGSLETAGGVRLFAGCHDSTATGVFDALRSLNGLLDDAGIVMRSAPGADAVAGIMHGALSTGARTMAMFDAARLPSLSDVMPAPEQLHRFESARALVVCFDQSFDLTSRFTDHRAVLSAGVEGLGGFVVSVDDGEWLRWHAGEHGAQWRRRFGALSSKPI